MSRLDSKGGAVCDGGMGKKGKSKSLGDKERPRYEVHDDCTDCWKDRDGLPGWERGTLRAILPTSSSCTLWWGFLDFVLWCKTEEKTPRLSGTGTNIKTWQSSKFCRTSHSNARRTSQGMTLGLERPTGTEVLTNSYLWPWLIRHAGWLDTRFRVKMESRHTRTQMKAHTHPSFFRSKNWYCSVFHSLTSDAKKQMRTIYTGDFGWSWCGRLDEDNAHIIFTEIGGRLQELSVDFLSHHVDISLLKRVKGLSWNGQEVDRRRSSPKLLLTESSRNTIFSDLIWIYWRWDRVDVCDGTTTFQKQNSRSCSCRGDEEAEEYSVDFGYCWRTRKHGRERWWKRMTMMSLRRNIGELRTSWRRLRWMTWLQTVSMMKMTSSMKTQLEFPGPTVWRQTTSSTCRQRNRWVVAATRSCWGHETRGREGI